jgi:hypothetical protein
VGVIERFGVFFKRSGDGREARREDECLDLGGLKKGFAEYRSNF